MMLQKYGPVQEATETVTNDARMSARFCITSERPDLEGDVVVTAGVDLSDHRRNPVVLLCHDLKTVIGKSESNDGLYTVEPRPELGKMYSTAYFQTNNEIGVQTYSLVKGGYLRGASIGFQVVKSQARGRSENGRRPPLNISKSTLREWSVVPLPMNPDAVREILSRSMVEGNTLSPYIRKALEPHASIAPVWANGATLKGYDPNEPRDADGKWTTGGDQLGSKDAEGKAINIPSKEVAAKLVSARDSAVSAFSKAGISVDGMKSLKIVEEEDSSKGGAYATGEGFTHRHNEKSETEYGRIYGSSKSNREQGKVPEYAFESLEDRMIHEIAHNIGRKLSKSDQKQWESLFNTHGGNVDNLPSFYAQENSSEMWAESVLAVVKGYKFGGTSSEYSKADPSVENFVRAKLGLADKKAKGKSMSQIQSIFIKADQFPSHDAALTWLKSYGYTIPDGMQPTNTTESGTRYDFFPEADTVEGSAFEAALDDKAIGTFAINKAATAEPEVVSIAVEEVTPTPTVTVGKFADSPIAITSYTPIPAPTATFTPDDIRKIVSDELARLNLPAKAIIEPLPFVHVKATPPEVSAADQQKLNELAAKVGTITATLNKVRDRITPRNGARC